MSEHAIFTVENVHDNDFSATHLIWQDVLHYHRTTLVACHADLPTPHSIPKAKRQRQLREMYVLYTQKTCSPSTKERQMTCRPEAYKIMDFSELIRPHNPENTLGSPLVVEGSGGTDLTRGEDGRNARIGCVYGRHCRD